MAALWIALGLLLFAWCPVQGQEAPYRYEWKNPRAIEKSDRFYDLAVEVEKCLMMDADYSKLQLRIVDWIDYEKADGTLRPVAGLYWPVDQSITIPKYLYEEDWLVKHEIIHFILIENGIGGVDQPNEALHAPYIKICAPTPKGMG